MRRVFSFPAMCWGRASTRHGRRLLEGKCDLVESGSRPAAADRFKGTTSDHNVTPPAGAPHTQAAASERAAPCRRATKHLSLSLSAGPCSIHPHIWAWPSIYLALSAPCVCFPPQGKLKPVGFVFLLLFGRAPTFFFLFQVQVSASRESSFRKTRGGSPGHGWGWVGWGWGVRREGLIDETESSVYPVWVLLLLFIFFLCMSF